MIMQQYATIALLMI